MTVISSKGGRSGPQMMACWASSETENRLAGVRLWHGEGGTGVNGEFGDRKVAKGEEDIEEGQRGGTTWQIDPPLLDAAKGTLSRYTR